MKRIHISVIVPVYKVEKYVERCARSLMEQTMQEIEYIFVDDCTPDESIKLLKNVIEGYPERKKCCKIIHHDRNLGIAAARNTGLKEAVGDYIIHCDSDDWVEKNAYEEMYRKAKETGADIIATDYYEDFQNKSNVIKQAYPKNTQQCIKCMLAGYIHCGTWNKLVRNEIYRKNNICFPIGIDMWEDVLTEIRLLYYAESIAYIPKQYYHYVQYNVESYTKKLSEKSLLNMVDAIEYLDEFFKQNMEPEFRQYLCYKKLTVKLNLLLNSRGNRQKDWNKLYPEANKWIASYKKMSIYWRIAMLFANIQCLFLFNIMAYLSNVVKK